MYFARNAGVIRSAVTVLLGGVIGGGFIGCGSGIHDPNFDKPPSPTISVTLAGAGQVRTANTAQFSATVTGSPNAAVTWQVNQINGGSTAIGTISNAGLYTAPATLPTPNTVAITAISQADTTKSATAQELILNQVPILTQATATFSGTSGAVLLDVQGNGFLNGAQLFASGAALTTNFLSATELQATFTPSAGLTSVAVTAINPISGSTPSNTVTAQLPSPPPVAVTLTGASSQTRLTQTTQFTATVANAANTNVTWQVNSVVGGATATGTISPSGLYTAPSSLPSPASVTITAISQQDPTKSASLPEAIWNPIPTLTTGTVTSTGSAGALLLDVRGTGFVPTSQILIGASPSPTTYVSATELQATFTPASAATSISVTVANSNPGAATSNAILITLPLITVTVSGPAQTRLYATSNFSATVTGTSNTNVTWQITPAAPAGGSITSAGVYTAPSTLPSGGTVTITATSQQDTSRSGTLSEAILNCTPILNSGTATPTGNSGAVLIDLQGSCLINPATIQINNAAPQATTLISSTELQATYTPAAGTTSITVTVTNPNPGAATSNSVTIQLPAISVTVTGASSTRLSQSTQFAAAVTGTSNTAVIWQVNGVTSGSAATGTISASGLYTAPTALPSANPVTITALSQQDTTKSGSLSEAVWNPIPNIASATVTPSGTNGALLLDVVGANFVPGATIGINGLTAALTNVISATEAQTTFIPSAGESSASVTLTNPNPGSATSNTYTVAIPLITISISGPTATRLSQTSQFTATVTNTSNTAVIWQVNGVTGGSTATGTISATGLFTAPAALPPSPYTVQITAISQQDATRSASTSESIWNPVPTLASGTAAPTGTSGALLIDVVGTNFVNGAQISVGSTVEATTYISATELQALYTPTSGSISISVTVTNPNPGSATSNAISITLPVIGVTVTGAAQTRLNQTTQFTATVTNTTNTAVTWQVNSVPGGGSSIGTISSTGLYTAPSSVPTPNPVTITAVSQQDTNRSGSLSETVWNCIPVLNSGTATPTGSSGAILLDLQGSCFVSPATLQINNGTAQSTTFLSATELQATFTPATSATSITVTVTNPNPGSATSNSITITLPVIAVVVTGPTMTRINSTAQMTATVTGTSNTAVTWQVNSVTGGSTATGTISTSGLFTAPATLPATNPVTITAISVQDPTRSGSLSELIDNGIPTITTVTPTLSNTKGSVLIDVIGTNFAGGAQIVIAGSSLNTTVISSTEVQATYALSSSQIAVTYVNIPTATTISVTVTNPNPGAATSNAVNATLPEIYAYTGPLATDYTQSPPVPEPLSPYFTASSGGLPLYVYKAEVRIVNFYAFTSKFTNGSFDPYPPYADNLSFTSFGSIQLNGKSSVTIAFPNGYPTSGPITSSSQVKILPTGAIDPTTIKVINNTVQFVVTGNGTPQQLDVEIDGDYLNSFQLFINPFETWPKNASNIPTGYLTQGTINAYPPPYHFGPGTYRISASNVQTYQTALEFQQNADIYLEDGAVIRWDDIDTATGTVINSPMIGIVGPNNNPYISVFLHGSGIIDGSASEIGPNSNTGACGYNAHPIILNNLYANATTKTGVDGIVIRNGCTWNIASGAIKGTPTNHIVVNNVKIFGWGGEQANQAASASDGIDILGNQYFDVTHSYIRTNDDLITVDQTGSSTSFPSSQITATNNILWNELAHAMNICCVNPSSAANGAGVDGVLFDHNTVIHDTGKATLMGVSNSYAGLVTNVTFSNITVEEDRALIGISVGPGYGVTANPAITQSVTFTNINQIPAQVTQTIGTYIDPVPNIWLLVQLPYGNPYIGNGTTSGTNPAVLQGPFNFNNVMVNGSPVTTAINTPGFTNAAGIPYPENIINETVLLRTQNTYGPFVDEASQVPLDMILSNIFCNSVLCTQQ